MRLLFLDAYFFPEQIAFTHLENDLIEGLVNAGHEVEVICPIPTRGISKKTVKKYRKIKHEYLRNSRVKVTRFYAPQERRNPVLRAFRYLWCNMFTYLLGIKANNIDAVFSNSTPPTQGIIAGKVAKKLGVPFIYSLQDVFPDSLVTTGLAKKNSLLWRIGRKIESKTYQLCSRIIVISDAMKDNLIIKQVENEKIYIIYNWIDIDDIYPIQKNDNSLFEQFNICRDKFIVLYAGNFGAAQGAEIVLNAAEQLQAETNIQFVIFGGGAGFNEAKKKSELLSNVIISPLLPQNRVSEVYSLGDVAIISCKRGVGTSGLPSKTWSIMACNTPIISSFDLDSELVCILSRFSNCVCVEPNNTDELINSIIQMYKKRDTLKNTTELREFVQHNNSKTNCVSKYINVLEGSIS